MATRGNDGYTLVECHLYTGRTHQIRVHMRHIAHPLVGDPLYGKGSDRANYGLQRQFLHSWRVKFAIRLRGKRSSASMSFLGIWRRSWTSSRPPALGGPRRVSA